MGENTAISWADHTFNPWIGCAKISPACDGCYAAALMGMDGRLKRAEWGEPGKGVGTRTRTKDWSKPHKWNREAAAAPGRTFVFCASLADVFDNAIPIEWRADLFRLIEATPNLTWLLLTKRPGNIVQLHEQAVGLLEDVGFPANAAIGCTVVNQEEANRDVPKLLAAKAMLKPAFAFLSMEPLLGPVDLGTAWHGETALDAECWGQCRWCDKGYPPLHNCQRGRTCWEDVPAGLDWIITGGETDQGGHSARPMSPAWVRALRDQCASAGVAFHHKQNGEWGHCPTRSVLPDHVFKVGKARAGRLLDGVEHNARPEVRA